VTVRGVGFGAAQGRGQVWLGTASGLVQSWSDSEIVAIVSPGSRSGKAQVLHNGVWSAAVPFNVNALHVDSVIPASPGRGGVITIKGTGFGPMRGNGIVWLGGAEGHVLSWSDTEVVAALASTARTGAVRIRQNGAWSNALRVSLPATSGDVTLAPDLVNLVVGDTRTIQALDSGSQPVTGLSWASTDTNVVSLSNDDPPILTAVAAGHVTITAGDGSADVTVSADALAVGTVLWSNPGNASGVDWIVPAVPSATGIADVFAFQDDSTVQAITSDGLTAWTADVSNTYTVLPDFMGGLVVAQEGALRRLDGITGQTAATYTPDGSSSLDWHQTSYVVHTDGTMFALESNNDTSAMSVIGVDPASGARKFSIPLQVPADSESVTHYGPDIYPIIVAGDGYAYVPYSYQAFHSEEPDNGYITVHLRLIRLDSGGTYDMLTVWDWTDVDPEACGTQLFANIITNADTGTLLTWRGEGLYCARPANAAPIRLRSQAVGARKVPAFPQTDEDPSIVSHGMAITEGASVTQVTSPSIPDQATVIVPVLQAQDGTFVGTVQTGEDFTSYMIAFNASGNLLWSVEEEQPAVATADGGVIAQSGAIYDQTGSATGQLGNLPTYSWRLNAYQVGSIEQLLAPSLFLAQSFWPFQKGNASKNNTALQQPWYAPLPSCPGAATPCAQEALTSALSALRLLLKSSCFLCNLWVFTKLPGTDQTSFFNYLSLSPRFYDGTRSYAPANIALCRAGWFRQLFFCGVGSLPVKEYLQGKDAVSQTPSDKSQGMQVFFNPSSGICNVLSVANPPFVDKGVLNQATLFHEALHGYAIGNFAGNDDYYLESKFGLPITIGESASITYYLEGKVIPGGAQGANTCQD
jgi:hypothetical protein